MSTIDTNAALPELAPVHNLPKGKLGVSLLILSEIFFFGTLIAVYLFYIGKDLSGPYPQDVLDPPFAAPTWAPMAVSFNSIFLLTSSIWIWLAVKALEQGAMARFTLFWALTIAFGGVFLAGTGFEWYGLIAEDGLWLNTNLFGSCFFTLVGFHAAHVTIGLLLMTIVLVLTLCGYNHQRHAGKVDLLSWYWHFVDGVWIFVFTVVYIIGYYG
ncbi:MAG: heme-copper oxidase subunit III [Phycisphaerales bacterium]|nr:heme-copper oxidase subunit III [Phycisphaerales bacterium]